MASNNNSEWSLISAVSLGSILEWYEIGLYIYWPLIVLGDLFNFEIPAAETINATLVVATGFIARPLGGIIFGRWGDKLGRQIPFMWSIIIVAAPSLLIAILPSYVVWSIFSTIIFAIVKFLQGIPAGGEVPGAICYLAENSVHERRRYLCSYAFVGPQIGLLISMAVCLLLQQLFNKELLAQVWWRMIFLTSGLIGILGFILRKKLHESKDFEKLRHSKHTLEHPIHILFTKHFRKLILGFCISIFEVVTFCLLTIIPTETYKNIFKITDSQNIVINTIALSFCAIAPPVIGKISSIYRKIPFFEISAIGILIFSYPFYLAIMNLDLISTLINQAVLIVFFSIQVALLPSLLAGLFSISIRYTGIGCSFNICDGVLWGLIPILSSMLIARTGNNASFIMFLPTSAIIFLVTFYYLKKKEEGLLRF